MKQVKVYIKNETYFELSKILKNEKTTVEEYFQNKVTEGIVSFLNQEPIKQVKKKRNKSLFKSSLTGI